MEYNDEFYEFFLRSLSSPSPFFKATPITETTIKVREMGRLGVVDFSTEAESEDKL